MAKRIIPIADHRVHQAAPGIPAKLQAQTGALTDVLSRPLQDLRISVTDRCNFRCVYCMPKEVFDKNYVFLPHSSMLSFEEIIRIAKIFVGHGVRKIRLTGGEPLLRRNIEELIAMLTDLRTVEGKPLDLTLTTNGSLLARKAQALKHAGLQRITVSLDSLDDAVFHLMNDVEFPVSDVLKGIEAAYEAGFAPIKVNMVVKAGMNDHQIMPMARYFKGSSTILRFIEYMDVGTSNGWNLKEVVTSKEIVRRINAELPIEEVAPNYSAETARRWRYKDGSGEIGLISSVTQAFCSSCSRARLSTEGKLYTCLFSGNGYDLRALIRGGCNDEQISNVVSSIWQARNDRYSDLRMLNTDSLVHRAPKIEMSYIGG